ncbi:hypothetical protein RB195_016079 [Necator americanus]|uniref:Uncharacterized protein n=1 Tax=Necator americanus TaxID=51031 RepID=A0ABR1EA38_NECAM
MTYVRRVDSGFEVMEHCTLRVALRNFNHSPDNEHLVSRRSTRAEAGLFIASDFFTVFDKPIQDYPLYNLVHNDNAFAFLSSEGRSEKIEIVKIDKMDDRQKLNKAKKPSAFRDGATSLRVTTVQVPWRYNARLKSDFRLSVVFPLLANTVQ